MERLTLTVVTPERAVLDSVACDEVVVPAERGELGILPGHTPLITLLGVGVVRYRDGGRKEALAIRDGFAEISADVVRVLADHASTKETVDLADAKKRLDDAAARRAGVQGAEELDRVNGDARFAEAELALKG